MATTRTQRALRWVEEIVEEIHDLKQARTAHRSRCQPTDLIEYELHKARQRLTAARDQLRITMRVEA